MILCWCPLIDLSVAMIRYQKDSKYYKHIHAYCQLFIDLLTIITFIAQTIKLRDAMNSVSQGTKGMSFRRVFHFYFGAILFFSVFYIHATGYLVYEEGKEKKNPTPKSFYKLKKRKMFFGKLVYFTGKYVVLIGAAITKRPGLSVGIITYHLLVVGLVISLEMKQRARI